MLVRWIVPFHVLSVITFFLAHGAGAAMAFRIRKETSLERMRAMLDLSTTPFLVYMLAYLLMAVTGLAMVFLLGLWRRGWVWVSVVLMLFVFLAMSWLARPFATLRKLVGLPYREGNAEHSAQPPASEEAVTEHLETLGVVPFVVVGYVIPAFVLWLMFFQPF
jgi:Ca2+/Na+ antiporter